MRKKYEGKKKGRRDVLLQMERRKTYEGKKNGRWDVLLQMEMRKTYEGKKNGRWDEVKEEHQDAPQVERDTFKREDLYQIHRAERMILINLHLYLVFQFIFATCMYRI